MKNKILLGLLPLFLHSCASIVYEEKGNYYGSGNYYWIRIEILDDSKIMIKENNGGIISSCSGIYSKTSDKEIVVDCRDIRGDSINKGSIVNIIPSEFSINGEVIKIKNNKIIYKKFVLNKIP